MSTFPSTWLTIAAAIGNHLWQSTLFAAAAGLLTLLFRKNHARVRYWIWLAASLKFLLPFSWLIALGSRLSWSRPIDSNQAFFVALNSVGRPFTTPAVSVVPQVTAQPGVHILVDLIPALLAIWLCGAAFLAVFWFLRWTKVAAIARAAAPLRLGREVDALGGLTRAFGISVRVHLLSTNASLEPGIFGFFRPVLVWPNAISAHLSDSHLQSILAHELCHVRRLDNLTAALHTIVESLFWFHPLVWWVGARLIEERELACDEEVVEHGSDRRVYAESILKICEFCTSPPLACVSGVTGADLKRRISRIMKEETMNKLDFVRKLLLATAAIGVLVFPLVLGLTSAPRTRAASRAEDVQQASFAFESVSIKLNQASTEALKSGKGIINRRMLASPNGMTATSASLRQLILAAYEVQDDRLSGGAEWISSNLYDVDAKIDSATAAKLKALSLDQNAFAHRHMLQAVLADHFQLKVRRETKELPVFALLVAEGGPKLKEATPGNTYPDGIKAPDGKPAGPGMMAGGFPSADGVISQTAQAVSMSSLAQRLSWQTGRTVLDMTGLRGNYDFTLQWKSDSSNAGGPSGSDPAFLSALNQQLGLKLEPQKALLEVLVIDHAEQPKDN